MNYPEMLKTSADKYSSIVCLGLDPVIEDIPEKDGTPGERIYKFYENILNAVVKKNIFTGAAAVEQAHTAENLRDIVFNYKILVKILPDGHFIPA